MDDQQILTRLGLALAIGFLIGVERGWRERDEAEGGRVAGLRTFALIGLSGGVWALLADTLGPIPLSGAFLAIAAALILFRWREGERDSSVGVTTIVAALLTFGLGAYAVRGSMVAAAAVAVAAAALLAAKAWLHAWVKALSWPELRSAIVLLAMSFVALPVLPNRGFGPYQALNPYNLWLMSIVIAGVSFTGYVAVRVAGERHGTLIAGIVGGVVSSTATTLDMARRARGAPEQWRRYLAGALTASAVMFLRVGAIVAIFGAFLLPALVAPLAAALVVTLAAALAFNPPWRNYSASGDGQAFKNPFDLSSVLAFAALLAVVLVLTKALTATFGGFGAIGLAALAGVPDVDAVTLSATQLAATASFDAEVAILVAVAANSLSKSVLAMTIGGRRFGLAYLGASFAALAAGGLVAIATRGSFAG
jgi:uncharacterized membrane protein (DUF4010 family)